MSYQEFENAPASSTPVENVARGTIFALAIIPAGVIVFVVIWNLGFLASIVSYGVAIGAVFLYRFGAGGVIGRSGAIRIAIITIGTVLLSIFAGIVSDAAVGFAEGMGTTPFVAVLDPTFWGIFWAILGEPGVLADYAPSIAIALGLGLVGCFSLLRGAFRAPAEAAAAVSVQPLPPQRAEPDFSGTGYTPSADAAPPVPPVFPVVAPQYGEVAPPVPPVAPPVPGDPPRA